MKHFNSFEDDPYPNPDEIQQHRVRFESMLKKNEFSFMEADALESLYHFYVTNSEFGPYDLFHYYCEELLDFAMSIHPLNTTFYELKFQQLLSSKEYHQALEWAEYCIEKFPFYSAFHIAKGKVLEKLNLHSQAVEEYLQVLSTSFHQTEIHFALARCFCALDKPVEGIEHLKAAIEAADEFLRPQILDFIFSYHDTSFGINALQYLLDKDPFYDRAWFYIAILYAQNQHFTKAIEAIEYAIAIDYQNPDYYLQKAMILNQQQQFTEAIQVLKEALSLEPDNEDIYFHLAICHQSLGKYSKAQKYLKKCIRINPFYTEAYRELAQIFYKQKRLYEASEYYQLYFDYQKELGEEIDPLELLRFIDIEIELEFWDSAIEKIEELQEQIQDDYLEIELLLRQTYIEFLRGNPKIHHLLRENFYFCSNEKNLPKLMFQAAALSFRAGSRSLAFFYLENALVKFPQNYEHLYDYNPDLRQDLEVQMLIESYQKT